MTREVIMQYAVDHIHFISPDPEKTARFYQDNFAAGRAATMQGSDGSTIIALDLAGTRLLVMQGKGRAEASREDAGKSYGLEHFGIITDDIEASVAALKGAGVEFRDEIRQARPGVKIAFFWGPDNELVELLERK